MEMETGATSPSSRKRKAPAPAATEATGPDPAAEDPEPPLAATDGDGGGVGGDHISDLPHAVLEDVVSIRPPAMEKEMQADGPCSRKRKLTGLDAAEAAQGRGLESTAEDQEPPLPGEDRISDLPDDVLGDIISLLPTREGARTQVLASQWRHLWRSAPLNLDHHRLCDDDYDLDALVSLVLAAHPGPGRRFCVPIYHLRAATADSWLRSPALNNLQELELCSHEFSSLSFPLPAAAFRFADTLCVATIGECHLTDNIIQGLHFPKLQKLALKNVNISECSLHIMIAACPALVCLLIYRSFGFRCVRINSTRLRCIGVSVCNLWTDLKFEELIIENAPFLESLVQLGATEPLHISVISAPKLGTLGCLSSDFSMTIAFDSAVIQGLRVESLKTALSTVKILAVDMRALSLDAVIDLMRCFPCMEKLYIESIGPGKTNLWRRKHQNLIRSLDICMKTIAWRFYRGIKSHVDFATFFLLNARLLDLMILQVHRKDYNAKFFAKQGKMLQLNNKASGGARLHFTQDSSHRNAAHLGVHDLDPSDPFDRKVPYQFHALY